MEGVVQGGKISFALGWWPLHLITALVVLAMFAWRLNLNHPYHPLAMLAAMKRSRNGADNKAVSP